MKFRTVCSALALAGFGGLAWGQTAPLPTSIEGRWTFRNFTNVYAIKDISAAADGTFSAKLTWWTPNPACAVKNEPIKGTVAGEVISFEATTQCNAQFSVELERKGGSEWLGKSATKNDPSLVATVTGQSK